MLVLRGQRGRVHSVYLPRVTPVGIQSNDKRAKRMRALRTVITARWLGGLIVAYSERRECPRAGAESAFLSDKS